MTIQYNNKRHTVLKTKTLNGIKIYTVRAFKSYRCFDVAFVNGVFVDAEIALKSHLKDKRREFDALVTTLSFTFDKRNFLDIQKRINDFRFLFLLFIF